MDGGQAHSKESPGMVGGQFKDLVNKRQGRLVFVFRNRKKSLHEGFRVCLEVFSLYFILGWTLQDSVFACLSSMKPGASNLFPAERRVCASSESEEQEPLMHLVFKQWTSAWKFCFCDASAKNTKQLCKDSCKLETLRQHKLGGTNPVEPPKDEYERTMNCHETLVLQYNYSLFNDKLVL